MNFLWTQMIVRGGNKKHFSGHQTKGNWLQNNFLIVDYSSVFILVKFWVLTFCLFNVGEVRWKEFEERGMQGLSGVRSSEGFCWAPRQSPRTPSWALRQILLPRLPAGFNTCAPLSPVLEFLEMTDFSVWK